MEKQLPMTISDMLKYRDILQEKADYARNTGKQSMLDAVLKRIDAIMVFIDAAFMMTINEKMPSLMQFVDIKMFDHDALKAVLPQNKYKALPIQGVINFSIVDEAQSTTEGMTPLTLKGAMQEILKRNFVEEIPKAVKTYRQMTNSKEPDSIVWIKIKELLSDNRLILGWDRVIASKLVKEGPIPAFYAIKKHLKDWSDIDISIMIDDATQKAVLQVKDKDEAHELNKNTFNALEGFKDNIREYLKDDDVLKTIKSYTGIDDKTRIGQHLASMSDFLVPSKRAKILTRKEYIEKGY